MEQARCGPESDPPRRGHSAERSRLSTAPYNPGRTDGMRDPLREVADGRTGHLSNQGELGKVVGSVSRGCESSVDFHPQFAAFSNFMGVDPGADQIHTLVITTFLLALLPTLQTQIKEKVSGKHRLVFKS